MARPPPAGAAVSDLGDAQRLPRQELNLPAFVYIETHGGTAIGGSDDHAGIDIGRIHRDRPRRDARGFLGAIRAGRAIAHGAQGARPSGPTRRWRSRSAASGGDRGPSARPRRGAADRRAGYVRRRRAARRTERRSRSRGRSRTAALLAERNGAGDGRVPAAGDAPGGRVRPPRPVPARRRIHERKLAAASTRPRPRCRMIARSGRAPGLAVDVCLPAIPYAAAAAFLGREKLKLTRSDGDPPRFWLVADGLSRMHGVSPRSIRSVSVAYRATRSR